MLYTYLLYTYWFGVLLDVVYLLVVYLLMWCTEWCGVLIVGYVYCGYLLPLILISGSLMMYFWHVVLDLRWISFVDCLMILVFDLYLVHVWWLVMWSWYWTECSYSLDYFIFLSSMCYLEVVLAIRYSLPRNVSCLISHLRIVHYLPCTVGVEAWLGNHAVGR